MAFPGSELVADAMRYSQHRAAFIVLALGVAISIGAWRLTEQRVIDDAVAKLEQDATRATDTIERRLQNNINLLIGLRGLFSASNAVNGDEFHRYLGGFNLENRASGVRAVSYAQRATPEVERRLWGDDYTSPPQGEMSVGVEHGEYRNEYLVIRYFEPGADNEAALGLNISDPTRYADIARARDSGQPIATAPFSLAITPQLSFAIHMPIYDPRLPSRTVAQRREAFQGVVSAIVYLEDLIINPLAGQLATDLALSVHDLGPDNAPQLAAPNAPNLIVDSRTRFGERTTPAGPEPERQATIDVAGRKWQLSFATRSDTHRVERALPGIVLTGGIVTSLLLFWLIWALSASRIRALKLAEQGIAVRTAEVLREQLTFIQQLIETVPQPIFFKGVDGRYLGVNKAWETFFGIPREQFIGKSVFELYPNDQELARRHHAKDQQLFNQPGSQSYEATIVAADGKVHHTIYNKATFNKPDGGVAGLIGTITDVTAMKDAQVAMRESEARFRDLTELASDWYWEQDAELRFTLLSSKVHEFSLDAPSHIGKTRWELPHFGVSDEQWHAHKRLLAARAPFEEFTYQRYDNYGNLRTISVSGRPVYDEQGRFKGYRGTGRDITEQREVEERIRHMAHHDALTGLPNRLLLHDRVRQAIAQAQRNHKVAALLFIDLDRFKNINDSLGHQVGDSLLRSVAERLTACTRGTDTVARVGGDEFVVVLTDLNQAEEAGYVAKKVLTALSQPLLSAGHELHVTPSVGVCAYPHDGKDVETLMRNADAAMYFAKEMGRNNYQFFTPQMNIAANERLLLENDLRHALEREEFTLYYQPLIDLRTGTIVAVEALIRWPHAQRGMVPPSQFIPVAEETGLITPIGEWVLRRACAQARAWQKLGFPDLQIAVNCSAQQFRREGIVQTVKRSLDEAGLPPANLELEITESIIVEHAPEVIARFKSLSNMGLQLSIDDFGTGYSSLSYLKRFPIDKLKIDQSFVRDISSDPDDAAIVTAIIALARSLELQVVAEGVETAEQLAFLKSLGCDRAQGYFFSKPLPADDFGRLLRGWNPRARLAAVA